MEERVIDRLIKFAEFCKTGKLCRSKSDFEQKCCLTHNYLYNTSINTKSNIGVDQIAKIHKAFPMLNLTWVITGEGAMITQEPDEGYKEAYFRLLKSVEKMKKAVSSL